MGHTHRIMRVVVALCSVLIACGAKTTSGDRDTTDMDAAVPSGQAPGLRPAPAPTPQPTATAAPTGGFVPLDDPPARTSPIDACRPSEQLRVALPSAVDAGGAACTAPAPGSTAMHEFDPDLINLELLGPDAGSELLPFNPLGDCMGLASWTYDNPNRPTEILLCPTVCQAVAAGARILVHFGCQTIRGIGH